MMGSARVVVIGAGIVGSSIAHALSLEGLSVTVIEPHHVGGGATAAGMGHIPVMDDSEAQFELCRYSQSLWNRWESQLPKGVEYNRCGTLWVAADDEEMSEVVRKKAFYDERGLEARILNPQELQAEEPNLRHGLAGGLVLPQDQVIYPPVAAQFFLDQALALGAVLLKDSPVTRIDGDSVLLHSGRSVPADFIVNATGWQASILTPGLEIRPRKGHLVITDRYPGYLRHQVLELGYLKSAHGSNEDSVAFNVQPRPTGQLLIGSSRQFGVSDSKVDRNILNRMIQRAIEYMPGIARLSAIRVWTGFRAATPDSLPIIGPHPHQPNLILATGHEGLGISTSLGTAALVAAHILQRPAPIPMEPYLPSRLASGTLHA
jgi:glycine/D-amino acid oxidase-like deaminating enzyme